MTQFSQSNVCLEVCIASLDDALATATDANRLELNAALPLGGLTPSLAVLRHVKQAVTIPVIAMVRPRAGGFAYSTTDRRVMFLDAELFLENGADGIAFGFLDGDGQVDRIACCDMLRIIGNRQAVFHRAFDVTPDPSIALEQLIDLGVTRIMTSGQKPTAIEGAPLIQKLIGQGAGRIEILPAGGIRPHNVQALIAATGCSQVHASLRGPMEDRSTLARPLIKFSQELNEPEHRHSATDPMLVKQMRVMLGRS